MPGPTAWQQVLSAAVAVNQTIVTTAETVVATLTGINSRGPGFPIAFDASVYFDVQAATTITIARIRQDSLTGTVVGVAQALAAPATGLVAGTLAVGAIDTPAGEYAGKTYVLTVSATNAGANWVVHFAQLQAIF